MSDLVAELNSLDFSVYIGGPMQAAIQAQQAAAMSTLSFLQAAAFEPPTTPGGVGPLRYVDFNFTKQVPNPNYPTDPASTPTLPENVHVRIPFASMLSVPALRIEEMTIDFNAKLTSIETTSVSKEFAGSVSLGVNFKKINLKASAAYRSTSTAGTSVEKTYNLGAQVKIVNDEMTEGLKRVLTMLEDSIVGTAH